MQGYYVQNNDNVNSYTGAGIENSYFRRTNIIYIILIYEQFLKFVSNSKTAVKHSSFISL